MCLCTFVYTSIYLYVIICFHFSLELLYDSAIASVLICFLSETLSSSSSLLVISLTFQVAYWIISVLCFFHFRLSDYLPLIVIKFAVLLALHWGLKAILNSLGWVTSLPLGSPVVGLPPFNLWTGELCSISSADDESVISLWLGSQSLRAGCTTGSEDGVGKKGYWMQCPILANHCLY